MITGANSGLGFDTSKILAKKNATVLMVCRNKEKGQQAVDSLKKETNNQNLVLHVLDVSRPQQIKDFAIQYLKSGQKLDCLINNAGYLSEEKKTINSGQS